MKKQHPAWYKHYKFLWGKTLITKYQSLASTGDTRPSRFIASTTVIIYMYLFLGGIIASIPLIYAMVKNPDIIFDPIMQYDVVGFMGKYINPIVNYIFTNLSIYFMLFGVFIAVKFIHKRPFGTLLNFTGKLKWGNFFIGFFVFGVLLCAGTAIDYWRNPEAYSISFDPGKFWLTLPLILIMTPIQTTTEELVFRGYVIQSFGLKIKNGMVLSLISGALFTLPHLANPEIYASSKMGVFSTICMILNYFVVGLVLAMVTIRTNYLEAAIGAHAVNNLFCFLLVSYPDTAIPTYTVFYTSTLNPVGGFISTAITAALFYLITVFLIKKTDKEVFSAQ